MTTSLGVLAKAVAGDEGGNFDKFFEFRSESIRMEQTFLSTEGIRGTRSPNADRARFGVKPIGGQLVMEPNPLELDIWLKWIMGNAKDGNDFRFADRLPEFKLKIDRGAKVFAYRFCKVSRATFRASNGGPLQLAVDILAQTEEVANAGTFDAGDPPVGAPYALFDCVLNILAANREVQDFELIIDNKLKADRFNNSQTRTDIPETGREVLVNLTVPYDSTQADLYAQAEAGAAAGAAFTNGGVVLTFTMPNIKFPSRSPVVAGMDPVLLEMRGRTFRPNGDADRELVISNDSVP